MTDAERMTVEKAKKILAQKPHPDFPVIPHSGIRELMRGCQAHGFLERDAQLKDVIEKADEIVEILGPVRSHWAANLADKVEAYEEAKKKAGV